ncbi:MAG: ribosome biogenesis GTPase YlqF [Clostridia bacterium]|nr:ribosome biogenesis GTPase YlqF [Clostridia bacterium]
MGQNDRPIHWYPGHMAAARRMLTETLPLVDVILEVRDARLPRASANPELALLKKPRLILLNKADLADPVKTDEWLSYFQKTDQPALAVSARNLPRDLPARVNALLTDKTAALAQKGVNRTMRALIAGIPNSGKSTLINAIAGTARTRTGDKPGVTRGKQWIKTPALDLLDSPGLLWPRLDDQHGARLLAFSGAINDEILDLEELALDLIEHLRALYPDALSARYGITPGEKAIDDFEAVCRKRGFLLKKNECDYARGARVLLDESRAGLLGRISWEVPDDLL